MIYHITTQSRWREFESKDYFSSESYADQMFIHCCEMKQVQGVLSRYFKDVDNLLLLHIDEKKLVADLKYEVSTGHEKFPHLYGVINKEAIEHIEKII